MYYRLKKGGGFGVSIEEPKAAPTNYLSQPSEKNTDHERPLTDGGITRG